MICEFLAIFYIFKCLQVNYTVPTLAITNFYLKHHLGKTFIDVNEKQGIQLVFNYKIAS